MAATERVLGKFNLHSDESVSGYLKGDFHASIVKDRFGKSRNVCRDCGKEVPGEYDAANKHVWHCKSKKAHDFREKHKHEMEE